MDEVLEDEKYIWSRLKYMKDWEQHLFKGKFSFQMNNKRIVVPVEDIKKFTVGKMDETKMEKIFKTDVFVYMMGSRQVQSKKCVKRMVKVWNEEDAKEEAKEDHEFGPIIHDTKSFNKSSLEYTHFDQLKTFDHLR